MKYKDYLITGISYLRQPQKRKLIEAAYQLRAKHGLEIGGPSSFFRLRGPLPAYLFAGQIDGVNFSNETVWEGKIKEGVNYNYSNSKTGYQYIAEATDLNKIADGRYDFLLSCHSLEHVANPIHALKEWRRVMKEDGKLVLVLPDKRFTFDIDRPYTTLEHLIADYENGTTENDNTHFDEILEFHNAAKDPEQKSTALVREMLDQNIVNRVAHHHVFSQEVVGKLLSYCGFSVDAQYEVQPFHLVTLARKSN